MNKSVKFWNRMAARYSRQPIADPESYQRKLERTRQFLAFDSAVLEYGCGTGSTALAHAPHVGNILAIDSSPAMIDIAEGKRQAEQVPNVEFRCATLEDIDSSPASYDAILALNVLHLLDNYESVVQRSYQLLKPGGVFVSSTACLGGMWRALGVVLALGSWVGLLPRVQFISRNALHTAHLSCGFEIVEVMEPASRSGALFLVARRPG